MINIKSFMLLKDSVWGAAREVDEKLRAFVIVIEIPRYNNRTGRTGYSLAVQMFVYYFLSDSKYLFSPANGCIEIWLYQNVILPISWENGYLDKECICQLLQLFFLYASFGNLHLESSSFSFMSSPKTNEVPWFVTAELVSKREQLDGVFFVRH